MQSRWVIIVLIAVLMAAAIIYGVWWWIDNEEQVNPVATPTAMVTAISALYALRR